MNVQTTQNPATSRPANRADRARIMSPAHDIPPRPAATAAPSEQKWLATGIFYLLAGWIILNSGWSTQELGYPLMVIGVILPMVPVIAHHRALRAAQAAQLAVATSEIEARKLARKALVYELRSQDYSTAI